MRVAQGNCAAQNRIFSAGIQVGAILHYDTAPDANPTSTGVTMRTGCDDEASANLVPFVPNTVPSSVVAQDELSINHVQNASTENLFRWTIDGSSQVVNWSQPTLKTVIENGPIHPSEANVYNIPTKDNVSAHIFHSRF